MTSLQMSITDRSLEKLSLAKDGQYVVRDAQLKDFLVVVGKRRMTFTVKGEGWSKGRRKSVYAAIGHVGEVSAKDARLKAKECLTRIARGLPPFEIDESIASVIAALPEPSVEPAGVTLYEAWERYLEAHLLRKSRSAKTIKSYKDHVERVFEPWRDRPLKALGEDPALVAKRHDEITAENGPYMANGAMRTLRAVYNHARKTHRYLPAGLPAWFDELFVLENPLRREFHLFSLLSGCRPSALKLAQPQHLDLRRRVLHIPAPKGGAKKAFDIPLSRAMLRCLLRALRLGRRMHPEHAEQWIFAAESASGHIAEQREERHVLSKYVNDLRQSFRTIAQAAGVPELDTRLLMNHALPGVNAGYITRGALMEGHLRAQQEKISTAVFNAVEAGKGSHRKPTLAWLRSAKVEALETPAAAAEGSALRTAA
jgi:integrase